MPNNSVDPMWFWFTVCLGTLVFLAHMLSTWIVLCGVYHRLVVLERAVRPKSLQDLVAEKLPKDLNEDNS